MRLEHVLRRLQAGRLRVAALDGRHKIDLLRRLEHRVYGRRPSVVEREGLEALEISDVARVLLPAGRYAELPETGAVPHGRLADEDQPRHLRLDGVVAWPDRRDRKSTRLNSSHVRISYAVFCLKKKKKTKQ